MPASGIRDSHRERFPDPLVVRISEKPLSKFFVNIPTRSDQEDIECRFLVVA